MSKDDYAKIESLILERMRRLDERFDQLEQKLDLTNAQLRIMSQHVAGVVGSEALNVEKFAVIEDRLDRIDRRLELRDA